MKTYLELSLEEQSYHNLWNWCMPQLSYFSDKKSLFKYQTDALENITKVLYKYFTFEEGKKELFNDCVKHWLPQDSFQIKPKDKKKFNLYQNYFKTIHDGNHTYINWSNFFNRACFWMATGSGKSLVLIKIIQLLDYLQKQEIIPKKDIMILLPSEGLVNQFIEQIKDFNKWKSRQIEPINLKNYEEDKNSLEFDNSIKVYYYRSDLIRNEKKETILNYETYDNNWNWYVFLDEAHRGAKDSSSMQNYVNILSRNWFLFNFSATFTDDLDYTTTCFNFNLEKFITAWYWKNLYLSKSYFDFVKDKDEFSEREKQKQVLKSLITFTLIKKSKQEKFYHNPLLITLVNSINTDNSDLLIFFKKLEEIASWYLDQNIFEETKQEIIKELINNKDYIFWDEKFDFDSQLLEQIHIEDILYYTFNASSYGKIQVKEWEKGKEIALQLETADKPFALIKIWDAKKFQKEKLWKNYITESSYENKKFFEKINENKDINILLGSRSFYEWWDSNRPNVINMVNIGKQDAKKFVLQGIGRWVRIQPWKYAEPDDTRKRLPIWDEDKNKLLESLFIFATDKTAVKAIVEKLEENKATDERNIELVKNTDNNFDLLIPTYKNAKWESKFSSFNIAEESLDKLIKYFNCFEKNLFILKYSISPAFYDFLSEKINSKDSFQIKQENHYENMDYLLNKIISHISTKSKQVGDIKKIEDEIIHFKHIKVIDFNDEEYNSFKEKIKNVINFEEVDKKQLALDFAKWHIEEKEFNSKINAKAEDTFNNIKIKKITNHYYLPLIYSPKEKIKYIKHIINIESEVKFIENLETYIQNNDIKNEWMFSKIDESKDTFHIPYFYKKENIYRKFFPDFVFWINNWKDYNIVFLDPKWTSRTDYENKVDEFEKLFFENGKPKVFNEKWFNITFDLKLIAQDTNQVGDKYKNYWLSQWDFSFLGI